jgi:hypothetical protein
MSYLALPLQWLKWIKNQQETHEGNKQNEEHEAERQQAHEIPSNDNDAIQHSTSFSMSLNNV